MQIELIPAAPAQESVLANLLELYIHDFSEFHKMELRPDGRFGYPHLPLYWSEPDHRPFLVEVDSNPAGLVLIKKGSELSPGEAVWDMAEFFIVRAHRRQGVGLKIAHDVWSRFSGRWEVRVMQSNRSAFNFWQCAVSSFTGPAIHPLQVERNGERWFIFTFESPQLR